MTRTNRRTCLRGVALVAATVCLLVLQNAAHADALRTTVVRGVRKPPQKMLVTAELCNGVPCATVGQPIVDEEVETQRVEAQKVEAQKRAEWAAQAKKEEEKERVVIGKEGRPKPPKMRDQLKAKAAAEEAVKAGKAAAAKPKQGVSTAATKRPDYCNYAEYQWHPSCAITLPNRFENGNTGPTARPRPSIHDPFYKRGPVGRLPNPSIHAVWVDHLNKKGKHANGRVSSEYIAEKMKPKEKPWDEYQKYQYPTIKGEGDHEKGPIGRLPQWITNPTPDTRTDDFIKAMQQEKENWQKQLESGGAAAEDLTPSLPTHWVHYSTFSKMYKKPTDPEHAPQNNGFGHANDLDFTNFAYKKGVTILNPYKEGPEFNEDNAINHPENLLVQIHDPEQSQWNKEVDADEKFQPMSGDTNYTNSSALPWANDTSHKVPEVVDELPEPDQMEMPVMNTSNQTVAKQLPPPLQAQIQYEVQKALMDALLTGGVNALPQLYAKIQKAAQSLAAQQAAANSSAQAESSESAAKQESTESTSNDESASSESGNVVTSDDNNSVEGIRAALQKMLERQHRVRADLAATQAALHQIDARPIHRRIANGYEDGYTTPNPDNRIKNDPAEIVKDISAKMSAIKLKQLHMQEEMMKTRNRLEMTIPQVKLKAIHERINSKYSSYNDVPV